MKQVSLLLKKGMMGLFAASYACVRPLLGPRGVCRFTPTCSQYAKESLEKYGLFKGGWMSVKRLSKCHPLHPGGYDPVP